jgi:alpha-L-arabinofuranosidase
LLSVLQDILDSLEFARGSAESTWGSVRAAMGHPEPFPVKHVAIGNEDCGKKNYRGKFGTASSHLYHTGTSKPFFLEFPHLSQNYPCEQF